MKNTYDIIHKGSYPLTAPALRPLTNSLIVNKNIMTRGIDAMARKHYLQTHEEHFQRAVEVNADKEGTRGGQNPDANEFLCRTEPQEKKGDKDIASCFATACDDMQGDAKQDNIHLIPPRRLELLLPG